MKKEVKKNNLDKKQTKKVKTQSKNKNNSKSKTSTSKNKGILNKNKKKNEITKKIDYRTLNVVEIEKALKKEKYKSKYNKLLMSTIYTLVIVASFAALVATIFMPVLEISGTSMKPTLNENEIVLAVKTTDIKQGDIIAFYHGNKILVKRVIGISGSWINITEEGNVYINNKLLEEPYVNKKIQGEFDIQYPYNVPEETYFVLGDDRSSSIDSRSTEIGSIKNEEIIGKVIFRVWPMEKIGIIN